MASAPRVVIIGGGFGGLYAAKALANKPVQVTLLDRRNHHLFQPLLYQVATAVLSPSDIAQPLRYILRRADNIEVFLAEVKAVDASAKRVKMTDGEVPYDYLIVATGATHSYFGHAEWEARAPGLKTLEDAIEIRARFLNAFEKAEREDDPEKRRALLTFVVVGGGPTGVELAGTLSGIAKRLFPPDFKRIDAGTARILLLEAGPRVLGTYDERISEKARHQLEGLGVEVRTGGRVTAIEPGFVILGGEKIQTENVLWAAGVRASDLGATLGAPLDKAGRVLVQPDLSLAGHPEVFVIGDLASLNNKNGSPVPGVAPAAMQMGRHAAKMILGDGQNRARAGFTYNDRGSLATIGRAAAVAQIGRVQLSGFIAWVLWLVVHIAFLIGFRNRLFVFLEWVFSYVGARPSARLITYYETGVPSQAQVQLAEADRAHQETKV